jgi:hypothetical protein
MRNHGEIRGYLFTRFSIQWYCMTGPEGGRHMVRINKGKIMIYVILLGLFIWPVIQVYGWLHKHQEKHNATQLLYQVSLFQMELLSGYLHEANHMVNTAQLNNLKQALYSADFTHERLVLAAGEGELASLHSTSQLMQIILRLQIGGERGLRPEEQQIFADAATRFDKLFAAYQKLMASGGAIVSSQNDKLVEVDDALNDWLKQKQLK